MNKLYTFLEPTAKKAVDKAKKASKPNDEVKIITLIEGFKTPTEAMHLQSMLWYAHDNGVEVIFISNKTKK